MREVLARVKANIRRTDHAALPEGTKSEGIVLDLERYDVYVDGKCAELTQREFDLLKFLCSQPGKVFSREELLRQVWQYEYLGDLRAVDVAVRGSGRKLKKIPQSRTTS
jgi:two-component system response regulator VicR